MPPGPRPKPRLPPEERTRPKIATAALIKHKAESQEKNFAKLRARAATIGDPAGVSKESLALRKDDRPLTEMQHMFIRHWAAGESILSAAARAGYNDGGTYGYKLSKDPAIIKIYQREKAAYEAACQMTRKRVMDGFLKAAEIAELQAEPHAMVAAWREIGKMCGYYEPKRAQLDINITGGVQQKVGSMSTETLMAIIRGEVSPDVIDMDLREVDDTEGD